MSSELRSNALLLQALLEIRPNSQYIDGLAQYLMSERGRYGGWGTTNETAFTLLALSDYVLLEGQSAQALPFSILINGEAYQETTLEQGQTTLAVEIPVDEFDSGDNRIELVSEDDERLYYVVRSQILTAEDIGEAEGIQVTRLYLDPETKDVITEVGEGEMVLVRLVVTMPEDGSYMILEDPLPGGLEAINQGLSLTSHDWTIYAESYSTGHDSFSWEYLGYNYKEIYPGRVVFFMTEVSQGRLVIEYLARALVPGEFNVLPAEITAMYDLSFWGRSAGDVFIVNPR
jgi:uncharacterized protein YfaS (alpha-2-macroglobulin family)